MSTDGQSLETLDAEQEFKGSQVLLQDHLTANPRYSQSLTILDMRRKIHRFTSSAVMNPESTPLMVGLPRAGDLLNLITTHCCQLKPGIIIDKKLLKYISIIISHF